MHRERSTVLASIAFAMDGIILLLTFSLVFWAKTNIFPAAWLGVSSPRVYGWIVLVYMTIMLGGLYFQGFYTFGRTLNRTDLLAGVVRATVIALASLTLLLFTFKIQYISRLVVMIYGVTSCGVLFLGKCVLKEITTSLQRRGFNTTRVLVCGTGYIARKVMENIEQHPDYGYHLIGLVDPDPARVGTRVAGQEVLGSIDQLPDILSSRQVDEVFFAAPSHLVPNLYQLVYICEEVGVRAHVVWDLYKPTIAKTVVRDFFDMPVLTFTTTPMGVGQLMVKRLMDFVGSLFALIILAPLLLVAAIAVKLTSPGPVLFGQVRSGLNGRPFVMYKFRTMVVDAERRLEEVKHLNEMSGPVFKATHDPRVTPIGRFLRKTSIDEFPQFWNVLIGQMSLVGARPPIPAEVENYERWQRRRLSMKPGLTCYWQISGRNDVDFEEWMRMDLRYIDGWSLAEDIKILLATVPAVLFRRGAK